MSNTIAQFIDEQRVLVEQREIDSALAYWDAAMCATPEAEERAAQAQAELEACYSDPERYDRLRSMPEPADRDTARQRRLLLDEFTRNQMPRSVIDELARREMEIDGIFASYRAKLGDRLVSENDISAILKSSDDNQERQAAWEAGKQIGGQVCGKLLELVEIRNREAKRLGFDNYYSMSMELQELNEAELFATLEHVSRELEPSFLIRKAKFDRDLAKRFGVAVSELRPWHYLDPFFQEAPSSDQGQMDALFADKKLEDILISFYDAIGLDIHSLLPKADLYEKPGKNQHAYCMTVGRRTGDVRVSCNLRPDSRWMGTLLHEFGHAVYDNEIDPQLPFFLKSISHIMTTEAIAEIMGRFVTHGAWLKRWADVPAEQAESIASKASEMQKTHMVVFTQWVMVITHFEREIYRDPAQELGALWWELVAKYQHVMPPDNPHPDAWASKIHLSTSPVYYHNYLMGEMIGSQLLNYIKTNVIASEDELISSPKVGQWLIEKFFRPGARYSWNDHVKYATGEHLNPKYFLDEMSA